MLQTQSRHSADAGMESLVERLNFLVPNHIALGYLIKLILHFSREVIVHDVGEVLHKEVIDHHTHIGRHQLALFNAIDFGLLAEGDFPVLECEGFTLTFLALIFTLLHIVAVLDC